MSKKNLGMMTVLLIPICIAINFVGGQIVTLLKLPLYLDVIGTILAGALAGPLAGALVGLVTNLILGITNPVLIPFALVNVAVGIVAGVCAKKGWFKSWKKTIATSIAIWAIVQITAVPMTVILFGGVAGGGSSVITAFFLATGQGIWQAVFSQSIIVETIDKIASTFIVYFIIKRIHASTLVKFKLGTIYIDDTDEETPDVKDKDTSEENVEDTTEETTE